MLRLFRFLGSFGFSVVLSLGMMSLGCFVLFCFLILVVFRDDEFRMFCFVF